VLDTTNTVTLTGGETREFGRPGHYLVRVLHGEVFVNGELCSTEASVPSPMALTNLNQGSQVIVELHDSEPVVVKKAPKKKGKK
jgi:hypothetical protein